MIDGRIYEILTKPYKIRLELLRLPADAHARLVDALSVPAIRYDKDRVQTSPEDLLLSRAAEIDAWERRRRRSLRRRLRKANRAADRVMDAAQLTAEERRIIVARCGYRMSWRRIEFSGGVPRSTASRIFERAAAKLDGARVSGSRT